MSQSFVAIVAGSWRQAALLPRTAGASRRSAATASTVLSITVWAMSEPRLTAVSKAPDRPSVRKPSRLPAHLSVTGDAPAAGALDELSRARLRRLLASFLGEFATLDAHLDLLDTRGA